MALGAAVVYTLWRARMLRPIADDYCWAARAGPGVVASVTYWYSNWTGDLFSVVVNSVLVGLPLRDLPWPLASLVPFIVTTVGVALLLVVINGSPNRKPANALAVAGVMVPWVIVAWWSFWWLNPVLFSRISLGGIGRQVEFESRRLAEAVTVWQNVNVQYVLLTCLSLSIVVALWHRSGVTTSRAMMLWVVAGLLAGTSGLVLGASLMTTTLCVVILAYLSKRLELRTRVARCGAAYFLGTLVGLLIAFYSPGTQARALVMEPFFEDTPRLSVLRWAVSRSVRDVSLAVGPNALVVVLIGGLFGACAVQRGWVWSARSALGKCCLLGIFAVNFTVVNRAAEATGGYPANWHIIPVFVTIFAVCFLAGIAAGSRVARNRPRLNAPLLVTLSIVLIPLCALSIIEMDALIQEREVAWAVGPAPTERIGDIEAPWVKACWNDLSLLRPVPVRE